MFVGGVIVGDQMQVEPAWLRAIDLLDKRSHSTWVWFASVRVISLPVICSRAANNVIVPWRT